MKTEDRNPLPVTSSKWRSWLVPALIAVGSATVLHLVISWFRTVNQETLPEGYRIQDWTSNWLMQTLGLEELIPFGPMAFWYSHVYPPLQDIVRYAFTLPETLAGEPISYVAVDFRLYALYAGIYGLVNALMYIWVRSLTRNAWISLGVTFVWAIHPGYLTVMTLLDPSPLAMITISLSLYFLFMFLRTRHLAWSTAFFAALFVASLARTVTQIHVLAVLVVAVISFWFMARHRNWWLMTLNVLMIGLLFIMPIRMQLLYATWDVTTYGGYHRVGPLWIDPRTVPASVPESFANDYQTYKQARDSVEDPLVLAQLSPEQRRNAQAALSEAERLWEQQSAGFTGDPETMSVHPDRITENALKFSSRFNTQEQVLDNYRLGAAANKFLIEEPLESAKRLSQSLAITVPEALRPASEYTQNYLVEKLPWRAAWDWTFSSWRYLFLISIAMGFIAWTRGWAGVRSLLTRYGWFAIFYGLLALPILFSNRFRPGEEDSGPLWTDAMRQKVFLEMPIWALAGYAIWLGATAAGRASWVRRQKIPIDR